MAKKGLYGVNTYRERTKKKIGRHKKRLNKQEKRQQKGWQVSYINLYIQNERNKVIYDLYSVCKGDYTQMTEPPTCMPDEYKTDDYVQSYRNYYVGDKKRFARYTNQTTPEFMQWKKKK